MGKGREQNTDKRSIAGILGAAALLLLFWVWAGSLQKQETEYFTITAFSVGKADALLLLEGDTAVLVDTGEKDDGEEILRELQKRGIRRLELLLITHFDKDHVGSAAYLMEHLEVSRVMMPDYEGSRPEYTDFISLLEGHPDVQRPDAPVRFSTGALEWTVYPAEDPARIRKTDGEYDNNMSLVARVDYGECRFLLTGDIEEERIRQMLAGGTDWSCDWIKMPHHGRYSRAQRDLLDAARPSFAVICCSKKNPAEDQTLEMLEERGIVFSDTSETSVVTVCDGARIEIN